MNLIPILAAWLGLLTVMQNPDFNSIRNQTKTDDFIVEPTTLLCAGFEWKIAGDENRNASVKVNYRKKGNSSWNEALPLLRIGDEKIYGHDQTRDFCYITDAVEGTVLAMETAGTNGQIYHLGTGVEITIEELTRATGEIMSFAGEYTNAPTYPGSVSRRSPDITKSKKELGFTAKVNWKEGLKETVDWYNAYFDAGKTVPHQIVFQ